MDDTEREIKTKRLALCRKEGEGAYAAMYDAHSFRDANDCFRDAKEFFGEAIVLADQLGLAEECEVLSRCLEHIRAVFRSQFVQ